MTDNYFIGQLISVTLPILSALLLFGRVLYKDAEFRTTSTETMKAVTELVHCMQKKVDIHDNQIGSLNIKVGVLEERTKKDRYEA